MLPLMGPNPLGIPALGLRSGGPRSNRDTGTAVQGQEMLACQTLTATLERGSVSLSTLWMEHSSRGRDGGVAERGQGRWAGQAGDIPVPAAPPGRQGADGGASWIKASQLVNQRGRTPPFRKSPLDEWT